jgi:hypothetical protein
MSFFKKIKFYIKNAIWNYKFWLFSKRKYVDYSYTIKNPISGKIEKVIKRRFQGYEYDGKIYQDNPGIPIKNEQDWKIIKKNL